MKSVILEDLLKDGFSKKFARYYLNIHESELNNPIYAPDFVYWAYSNGFTAESASVLGITEENKNSYLCDYDYYKVWPLNNWTRIWINDKLTLKYTLSKSGLDKYMPKYYYYTSPNGLRALMDNENKGNTIDDFIKTLQDVETFACKICNGAASAGFFVLKYADGQYYINDKIVLKEDIKDFVNKHPNYVFTEYLRPCTELKKYGDLIHTIRIIVLNKNGNNPKIVAGYIRFPNSQSGVANYIAHNGTNNDAFNIYVGYYADTGKYGDAIAAFPNRVEALERHPDTSAELNGILPLWKELNSAALSIAEWFNNIEFMGYDFCISEQGVKLMEINTHPGCYTPQLFFPYYQNIELKKYFEMKVYHIDSLRVEDKKRRNAIER